LREYKRHGHMLLYFFLMLVGLLLLAMVFITIFSYNIIQAILGLIFTFMAVGLLFMAMGLEYMGFLIFIIYVGAISIIFLFVVMLLDIRSLELQNRFLEYFTLLLGVIFFYFFQLIIILLINFD
jgi:NADH:ubiquinone oxidoreductase subunit 6 (subunit J)